MRNDLVTGPIWTISATQAGSPDHRKPRRCFEARGAVPATAASRLLAGERRSACQSDGRLRAPPSECGTIAGVQRIHHVAMVTSDYGKLLRFYRDAFDAVGPDACEQPSVVDVGTARLHVFEEAVSGDAGAHGRLHHFALEAEDLDEFVAARNRLLSLGACDERVIDFGVGAHVSLLATDPDGGMVELLVAVDPEAELPFAVERHE